MAAEKIKSQVRIPGLDGLRAIAILCVLMAHSVEDPPGAQGTRWIGWLYKLGPFGVRLFFAISGYLITSLFAQELARHGARRALHMFYIRRAFRILPPLVPYLAALVAVGWLHLLPASVPVRARDLAAAGLFLGNYLPGGWLVLHFWSLAVEEHFYLFWPPLMALLGARKAAWWCVAIIGAVAAIRPWTLARHAAAEAPPLLMQTHLIVDFLVWAALLALLVRHRGVRAWLAAQARPLTVAALCGLLVLVDVAAARAKAMDARSLEAALFALIVVLPTLRPEMLLTRWLEHPALMWVGRRSYSIYIWHALFLIPFDAPLGHKLLLFAPRVLPILVVAALSYRFVEEPLIRKGRLLAQKRTGGRAVAAAAGEGLIGAARKQDGGDGTREYV